MARATDESDEWLWEPPTRLRDATLDHHRVQQHIACSLYRIAQVLEAEFEMKLEPLRENVRKLQLEAAVREAKKKRADLGG